MGNALKHKLVLIEWLDSKGVTTNWEYLDELEPVLPVECVSTGFLIDDKKDYKTLAQTLSKNQVLGRITIPCCSITKIKRVGNVQKVSHGLKGLQKTRSLSMFYGLSYQTKTKKERDRDGTRNTYSTSVQSCNRQSKS